MSGLPNDDLPVCLSTDAEERVEVVDVVGTSSG
jgi:hypothetical protein